MDPEAAPTNYNASSSNGTWENPIHTLYHRRQESTTGSVPADPAPA
jgi:hypothetical protein